MFNLIGKLIRKKKQQKQDARDLLNRTFGVDIPASSIKIRDGYAEAIFNNHVYLATQHLTEELLITMDVRALVLAMGGNYTDDKVVPSGAHTPYGHAYGLQLRRVS